MRDIHATLSDSRISCTYCTDYLRLVKRCWPTLRCLRVFNVLCYHILSLTAAEVPGMNASLVLQLWSCFTRIGRSSATSFVQASSTNFAPWHKHPQEIAAPAGICSHTQPQITIMNSSLKVTNGTMSRTVNDDTGTALQKVSSRARPPVLHTWAAH